MGKSLITPDKKLYGTATVGTKGQIVIPSDAREELDIKPGDRLYVMNAMHGAGVVLLKEEMLESFVEEIMAQVEVFRTLKQEKDKE
ncbi:MAG TPA: AbrB/MazE/SpoVT family DNA-binding domain-containing protein [Verrucomicrobiae bacterium]|nr:AbrB/MazE/SpoVT family DNA-binding domain-containing protein [Verrucomicrobiae bacterium]